jgi:hypothetical protein
MFNALACDTESQTQSRVVTHDPRSGAAAPLDQGMFSSRIDNQLRYLDSQGLDIRCAIVSGLQE